MAIVVHPGAETAVGATAMVALVAGATERETTAGVVSEAPVRETLTSPGAGRVEGAAVAVAGALIVIAVAGALIVTAVVVSTATVGLEAGEEISGTATSAAISAAATREVAARQFASP